MKIGHKLRREILVFAGLYNVPISGWLYFGEAGGVPLAQARRALGSWIKLNEVIPSIEEANRKAAELVRTVAHPKAGDRLARRKVFAEMMQTGRSPDPDDLLYFLQQLIDPRARGEVKGPLEAPLSPESLRDMILARAEMLRRLRDEPEQIPDGIWEWARFVLLWTRGWYQEAQPRLAADPSVRRFPELRDVYRAEDFESIVNAACKDLLSTLALAPLAEGALHLPLELRPEPWLEGRLRLAVRFRAEFSPILLPDGSRRAFVGPEVTLTWIDR